MGATLATACDLGPESDEPHTGPPLHLVGQNASTGRALVTGTPIELTFDRLLDPSAVTRQSFYLQDLLGNYIETDPSYDPVSRVVRFCLGNASPLQPDQTYRVTIVSPQGPSDPNGLRAIDGATLDPASPSVIEFPVIAGPLYAGSDACNSATAVDFCSQVLPIFENKCGTASCHGVGALPAAGLLMTTAQGIQATAIGRVAQGANTGLRAQAEPPTGLFGIDMPIIDPTAPGDSWLVYKLLLAPPPPCSSTPGAPSCNAAAPGVQDDRYPTVSPAWSPLSDDERALLANFVPGREMPYPADPASASLSLGASLTVDELDTVSFWIAQGAATPASATGCPQ